ncbi:hypothetical protein B0H11DRAFT_1126638 [Mycena galericulata]|nr:hypothetical protein B0H11DRAFT_1126638 [Mycena galericulata]
MNDYGACYGCEVQVNGLTQADAQQTVDDFASGCQTAGHPVASITINADGSTSGGGAAPTASGASPAASGASPAASGASPAASGASPAESGSSPAASGATPAASGSSGSAPAGTKSGATRASTSLAGVACALLFASYASW